MLWADLLDSAADRRDIAGALARELINSEEFRRRDLTNEMVVMNLYQAFLGRFPEDDELAFWAGEIEYGDGALEDLMDALTQSAEFAEQVK